MKTDVNAKIWILTSTLCTQNEVFALKTQNLEQHKIRLLLFPSFLEKVDCLVSFSAFTVDIVI